MFAYGKQVRGVNMVGEVLKQLGVIAILVQRAVAFIKKVTGYTDREPTKKYQGYIDLGLSVVLSSLICVGWEVNIFAAVGLYFPNYWGAVTSFQIGSAVTGVLASLGSNVLNDLLALYKAYKDRQAPQ